MLPTIKVVGDMEYYAKEDIDNCSKEEIRELLKDWDKCRPVLSKESVEVARKFHEMRMESQRMFDSFRR